MLNLHKELTKNGYIKVRNIERGLTYRILDADYENGWINCQCLFNPNVFIVLPIELDAVEISNPMWINGTKYGLVKY